MTSLMLILALFIMANLPWFTERLFLVYPLEKGKSAALRWFELFVLYFAALVVGGMAEMRFSGDIHPQQWEFFATTLSAFLVLSVPGLIYRYQWLPLAEK